MIPQNEYVAKVGQLCPFCTSYNIGSMGEVDVSDGIAWQRIQCNICKSEWNDSYKLVGYSLPSHHEIREIV